MTIKLVSRLREARLDSALRIEQGEPAWIAATFLALMLGCGGGHAENPEAEMAAKCLGGGGVRSITDLNFRTATQPIAVDNGVVLGTTDAIISVSISSGTMTTLTSAESPSNVAILEGNVYYSGLEPVAAPEQDAGVPIPSQQQFFAVPIAGGPAAPVPSLMHFIPVGVDDSALFLINGSLTLERWSPPSGEPTVLAMDNELLVDAVTVQGGFVYIAAQDIATGGFTNGVIARVSKTGGSLERIVTNIGHPWNIASDAQGLYWSEDRPGITGTGRLATTGLAGGLTNTLISGNLSSVVVESGRVFYSRGNEIDSISTAGGPETVIAPGLMEAGLLSTVGANLVWVDPAQQAFGGQISPQLMTVCALGS
jgi:hypothetical protein